MTGEPQKHLKEKLKCGNCKAATGRQQCSSSAAEVFWVEVVQRAEVGSSGRKAFLLLVFCTAEPKSAYKGVERTAGVRHAAPLPSTGTVVSRFFWERCLYMTQGNTVVRFKRNHCRTNSTSISPSSSLSSVTWDCGHSFHPSRIPFCPVASCLVPCWDSSGAEAVRHYGLSQYQYFVVGYVGIMTNDLLCTKLVQNLCPELTRESKTHSHYLTAICPVLSHLVFSFVKQTYR